MLKAADDAFGLRDVCFFQAQSAINEDDAQAQLQRIMSAKFDFNDFLKQWKTMNDMGGTSMMKLLPGFNKVKNTKWLEQRDREMFTRCLLILEELKL